MLHTHNTQSEGIRDSRIAFALLFALRHKTSQQRLIHHQHFVLFEIAEKKGKIYRKS